MRIRKPDYILLFSLMIMLHSVSAQTLFTQTNLPAIPDKDGFAGSLAGVSNGALIVAGGSNFPNGGRPWNGGTKTWYDQIFVLEKPTGQWIKAGTLPRPLGYAVSLTWRDALVCVGGSNATGHFADSFLMRWQNHKVVIDRLPDFPTTIANACGAMLGDVLYVAGGLEKPTATEALHTFYTLDLSAPPAERAWKALPSWTGDARMLSVAATAEGQFYLFSGAKLVYNPSEKTTSRVYLKDAHRYDPRTGQWTQLADLPHATVAAPTPAFAVEKQVIVFGGDSGEHAANTLLRDKHPGFKTAIIGYDIPSNQWKTVQEFQPIIKPNADTQPNESTYLPVTTPLVGWRGGYVLPGGEVRPGTRTPRVLLLKSGKK